MANSSARIYRLVGEKPLLRSGGRVRGRQGLGVGHGAVGPYLDRPDCRLTPFAVEVFRLLFEARAGRAFGSAASRARAFRGARRVARLAKAGRISVSQKSMNSS